MWKVLAADDESYIREALQKLIDQALAADAG